MTTDEPAGTTDRTRGSGSGLRRVGDDLTARIAALRGERVTGAEDPVLLLLVGAQAAAVARKVRWATLVLNPGSTSTKLAAYDGLELVAEGEVAALAGPADVAEVRVEQALDWITQRRLRIDEISGIAARGGILPPLMAGTYRICAEMVDDLAHAPYDHPSNLAVPMALRLAEHAAPGAALTTTDPGTVDEVALVYKLTGSSAVVDERVMAHYLNQRAVAAFALRALDLEPERAHLITCHLGGGTSAIRHLRGRMVQVSPPFGGMPSANRAGALPLHRVIALLEQHAYTIDELKRDVITGSGGLLSLAGTSSLATLVEFRERGASAEQRRKVELILDFFADRVAAAIQALAACRDPVDAIVLTGGLARDDEFCERVRERIQLPVPVARVPGSLEQSALAAGLLRSLVDPSTRVSYAAVRDELAARREAEHQLLSLPLIASSRRRFDCSRPPAGLDDILEAACGDEPPTIALVGADNPEALLAVKSALERPGSRMARFLLLGPYGSVSHLAWELDVPIDDETAILVDAPDPVSAATELLAAGLADTLMKGSCMTADVLKGYLAHLKAAGRAGPELRLSHVGLFEIPGRPGLVAVTDAAMNTYPDVEARIEILDNALGLMRAIGYTRPRVAVISATEKPSGKVASSVEARAIADRFAGRSDLLIEGPLSVDLSLSPESAREKRYSGRIRGDADLLLVPDIDAGNAVYKSFTVASGATLAGVIVGGDAPLILTSRGDSARTKLTSIALACLLIRRQKGGTP